MATRMQQRKGTAEQWLSTNNGNGPILNSGEIGYESDTNKFKIGDGVNHWIDLNYFADAVALGGDIDDYIPLTEKGVANGVATLNEDGVIPSEQIPSLVGLDTEIADAVSAAVSSLVDSAPAALNTLNELAAAINDDANFATTVVDAINLKQNVIAGVSDVELGFLSNVTEDIQQQLNDKADDAGIEGRAVAALVESLTEGSNILITHDVPSGNITISVGSEIATEAYADTAASDATFAHNQATTTIHGIDDTAELATKTFAANLLVNATKTNIEITGDKDGLIITAENGVADSTTDNLSEGTTNKYYTDARVETKLSNSVGTGLSWDGVGLDLTVDQTVIQARVADVSDTEIGYLNGVTSAIQDQIDDKASATSPTISTSLTLDGTGDFTISADANIVFDANTEVYIGSAVSGNEVATESYVDSGLSNKLDSSTAATTYAPLAGPTFTGTTTTDDLVVEGDFTVTGTTTTINTTDLSVTDPLIYLASNQYTEDVLDVGFLAATGEPGGTEENHLHSGFFRDASDSKKWKLVSNVPHPVGNVVDITNATKETLVVGAFEATSATIGDVSNTELQYLNGVTSAVQTQLDAKAPLADPTFTGTVSGVTATHVGLGNVDNTSDANKPISTATQTALDAKVNSLVSINSQTTNYTLVLADGDKMVEMNVGSANTLTVPENSAVALPIGTRIHVVQAGSGQTTITPGSGVTVNGTPGLKTRAQWSAVTLVKRATDTWVAFGDLTA
jgi:hypothetical protein